MFLFGVDHILLNLGLFTLESCHRTSVIFILRGQFVAQSEQEVAQLGNNLPATPVRISYKTF
ncbi:hypothetical protein [uncultured Shewanella sp.]|uniref:hypothetical protein n=1 Tax=uncultured Shewanella sp. TaxID=173975 RepID=UPI00260F21C0|nr:hypothetical protein [uncultured Shewanella sp.]